MKLTITYIIGDKITSVLHTAYISVTFERGVNSAQLRGMHVMNEIRDYHNEMYPNLLIERSSDIRIINSLDTTFN